MQIKDINGKVAYECERLEDIDWSKNAFRKLELSNAVFDGLKLNYARFIEANLAGASFNDAKLTGASFVEANLAGASFDACNLRRACFSRANLTNANFHLANLTEANLNYAQASLAGFHYANLDRCNAYRLQASKASFIRTRAVMMDASSSNFSEADLMDSLFTGTDFGFSDFRQANFTGCCLVRACITEVKLDGATIEWTSHDLIAEILRQEAGDDIEKQKIAGFILINRGKCWRDFLQIDDPLKSWALEVLSKYGYGRLPIPDGFVWDEIVGS
jgi:uncharacterized protein YjbI with pentapeptide repeats